MKATPTQKLAADYKAGKGPSVPMISPTQRAMDWEFYLFTVKQLQGNVLTVLDAAFTEGTQSKAIKDLVKGYFRTRLVESQKFFFDGVCVNETWPEWSEE